MRSEVTLFIFDDEQLLSSKQVYVYNKWGETVLPDDRTCQLVTTATLIIVGAVAFCRHVRRLFTLP